MRRLLIALPSRERGGAEKYALTIARRTIDRGWEVCAAFPECAGTHKLICDFNHVAAGYSALNLVEAPGWFSTRIASLPWNIVSFRNTLRQLRQSRPDMVHVCLPWPTLGYGCIVACACLRIPTLVTFQLVPDRFAVRPVRRWVYNWARKRSQRWSTVSENNRNILARRFGLSRNELDLIHNGTRTVSPVTPSCRDIARRALRDELGLHHDTRILLTVGRLTEQKGYRLLLPAIAQIVREFPALTCLWVGEGELRNTLEEIAKQQGVGDHVVFIGHQDDLDRIYLGADLFVFPTLFEGWPFALLESMAFGLPIVSSDASAIGDVIESGKHGLIFRAGDSDALRTALMEALGHPGRMLEMADRARALAAEFTEQRMVDQTLALFDQLSPPPPGTTHEGRR